MTSLGCCQPTCACCTGLGIPETLCVTIENFTVRYDGFFDYCADCATLNGDWYPTLTDYAGVGESKEHECYYHISRDFSTIACDMEGTGEDEGDSYCASAMWGLEVLGTVPPGYTPDTIDMWVKLYCPLARSSMEVSVWILQDASNETLGPGGSPVGEYGCVGAFKYVTISDETPEEDYTCRLHNKFCPNLIDGVVMSDVPYAASACVADESDPSDPLYGVIGYTVKRVMVAPS